MGILDGKVIVITGASRGLGEAMALGFAREGAALVLGARTTADLERVAQTCKEAGARSVTTVECDITVEAQATALVETTFNEHGRIDCFVANAGTSYSNLTDKRYRELHSYDLDIVKQLFDINAVGTWLSLKTALPRMAEGGSFIFIGSETHRIAYPGAGVYALTKAVHDVMTRIASKEVAEQGIRVNCLEPGGMVDTHLFGPNKMPDFLKEHGYLEPDVMQAAAVWLASDESKDVTGQIVVAKDFNERGPEPIKQAAAEAAALAAKHSRH
jgi:NAD(P)-dependent dehydrogenase (short-subunit alcohol dehydrogenase family)